MKWTKRFYEGYLLGQERALAGEPRWYIVDHIIWDVPADDFDKGLYYAARLLAAEGYDDASL